MTDQQRLFVDAYLGEARGNATHAARIAGYAEPNTQAWRIRNLPEVKAEIDRRLAKSAMSADEVLWRVSSIARASMADAFDTQQIYGTICPTLNFRTLFETGLIHAVKSLRSTEHGPAIELQDAGKALNILAQYHNLLKRSHTMSPEELLSEVTDIVLAHVNDPDARQKIATELERIAGRIAPGVGAAPEATGQ